MRDTLYYGDNLDVLRQLRSESVDLIYLDPPFNSQRNYNLVFRDKSTAGLKQAFRDVWRWDDAAENAYNELIAPSFDGPPALREIAEALYRFFGPDRRDDMAYPAMMAIRLVEMHRVLKPTGSLYLHCDPTASHYLKLILDAIFGADRFLNEIVWQRSTAKNDPRRYGRCHDCLLFYSKTKDFTWNQEYTPFQEYSVLKNYTASDPDGRRYRLSDLTANKPGGDTDYEWHGKRPYKGRHWAFSREKMDAMLAEGRIVFRRTGMPVYKRYLDEMPGVPVSDVWTDIPVLASASPERIGYPTQKPVALLKRLIEASSNKGDVVLDPFCGCGTTIEACIKLSRTWIGIDIAHAAVDIIRDRLDRTCPEATYAEVGIPADWESAERLAKANKYAFQWWVVSKIRGRSIAHPKRGKNRKGGDRGVDGEIIVREYDSDQTRRVIISVKGGSALNPGMVRDLIGTVANEKAHMGVLVTMYEPTDGMRKAAREAGTVPSPTDAGGLPRFQIITVADVFANKLPELPGRNVTQDSAPAHKPAQPTLPGIDDIDPPRSIRRGRPKELQPQGTGTPRQDRSTPITDGLQQSPRRPPRRQDLDDGRVTSKPRRRRGV